VIANIAVTLQRVIDLTDVSNVQALLDTNAQELTGDGRGYQVRGPAYSVKHPVGIAQTQKLGAALFSRKPKIEGFEGISKLVHILAAFSA
jgi:hypothetical protein